MRTHDCACMTGGSVGIGKVFLPIRNLWFVSSAFMSVSGLRIPRLRFVVFQHPGRTLCTSTLHTSPVTKDNATRRTTVTHESLPLTKRSCRLVPRLPALTHRARNPCHRLGSRRVRVKKSGFVKCSAISVYICGARAPGRHIHIHIRSSFRPSPAISQYLTSCWCH